VVARALLERRDAALDRRVDVDCLATQPHLAGRHPRDIEQIVDEAREMAHLAAEQLAHRRDLGLALRLQPDHLHRVVHGRQRIA
jgi:hypothetical protein